MFAPPEELKLVHQVEARLEDLMATGEFVVGSRLPGERALLKLLNVSRPVVREAISRLESRGLLRVYPSRGTFVTGTPEWGVKAQWQSWVARDRGKLLALLEVRECLEVHAAALATERASESHLAELRLAQLSFEQQCERGSLADMSHWDKVFHYQIAVCSGNPVLASFIENVNETVRSARRSILADPEVAQRSLDDHRRILEAMERRDAAEAMRAVSLHIAATREAIARIGGDADGDASVYPPRSPSVDPAP